MEIEKIKKGDKVICKLNKKEYTFIEEKYDSIDILNQDNYTLSWNVQEFLENFDRPK